MSGISDNGSEGVESGDASPPSQLYGELGRDFNRSNYGRKGSRGPWAHLDKDTRERYEEIEARVREKVKRGEL